tara:strand:- start:47 stop:442 length:396 start_codon:yes stop_codon:yes gene_type:complete
MKKIRNKIEKIYSNKKKTNSTILFILDKIDKLINIKRIFFINSSVRDIRGKHGHKKCTQVFVSINGKIKIEIFNGKKTKYFIIRPFIDILKVEPNNWVKIHFKKKQLLMVLCDQYFNKKDYIFDKSLIGKK